LPIWEELHKKYFPNRLFCSLDQLIEGDGKVHSLPTEGLRLALEQVLQGNLAEKLGISSGNAAVYAFLHVLKWEMQAAKSAASAPE
jgi:hypothetical protein